MQYAHTKRGIIYVYNANKYLSLSKKFAFCVLFKQYHSLKGVRANINNKCV